MRFSSALALIAAPLVLAGTIQEGIVRRSPVELDVRTEAGKGADAAKSGNSNQNNNNQNNNNQGGNNVVVINQGLTVTQKVTEIVIIWVNNGAGAATSTVNTPPVAAPAAAAAATHTVSYKLHPKLISQANISKRLLLEVQQVSFTPQIKSPPPLVIWSSLSSWTPTTPSHNPHSLSHVKLSQVEWTPDSCQTQTTAWFQHHKWPCKSPLPPQSVSWRISTISNPL